MQIIMTIKEQARLIDIAKAEGVGSVKEFQMWLTENRDLMFELFPPDIVLDCSPEED